MTRTITAVLAAAVIVLVSAGCGATPEASTPPVVTETPRALPTPEVEVPVTAATLTPAVPDVPPVRVAVSSVDIDVPVVPVGIEPGGFMELDPNPAVAGWYRFGADPTSGDGNVVISAHVDAPEYPIGPFSRLRDLGAGAEVSVTDAAGTTHRYRVDSVTYYRKTDLPVDELFARQGSRDLVLITCGGEYDPSVGRYRDNVVTIATPVD
ncbi:class F sortase [Microbacterium koreense]|uniref:Class F sortase n=1 Tax=Microbacterium koreense TaxID=323761 RepID=A0ABW2ZRX1_9MICO